MFFRIAFISLWLSSVIAVHAQSLPETTIGAPAVLLANGGFDAGDDVGHPIAWSVSGDVDGIKIVNRKAFRTAGLGSLQVDSTKSNGLAVRSRRMIAVPGGAYTLTAKVKIARGTPASLAIEFWSFDNKLLSENHATPDFETDWQTLNINAVAPEGSALMTVAISAAKGVTGISFWDEVDLQLTPPPYDPALGSARELFLDDYRIESADHVNRVVHPAEISPQPIIRPDQPWENSAYIYGSVFKLGGEYRMWYTAYNDVAPNYHMAYAVSKDGLAWTKPSLGLVDFKGSKKNNLIDAPGTMAYNPDAPPDRRYVSLGFQQGIPNKTLGYYIWYSPDGFGWKRASDKPALLDGDVSNIAFDPIKKIYIATVKKRMFTSRTPGTYERSAFVSTSADALTWTPPRLAVMGDYADDGAAEAIGGIEAQIYGMPVARYESTYVGFPWMYYILNFTQGESAFAGDGPINVQIASSRDLQRWSRPIRDNIIPPGTPGSWDAGCHYTASNLFVDDDKITIYFGAFNNTHGGGDVNDPNRGKNVGQCGIATWRRDGWVSMTNDGTENLEAVGHLTTKPLTFDGRDLHLNVTVRPGGSVKVEALDADGKPISGFTADQSVPLEGDHLNAVVSWSGGQSLADLAGRPVRFRFTLANTDLYSYWITPQ